MTGSTNSDDGEDIGDGNDDGGVEVGDGGLDNCGSTSHWAETYRSSVEQRVDRR